ncbi:Protein-glutamine gamma-glutamyltransferase [Posidoniimonas corsicana]|uniref:Protein-glutamine gamma-glutamyltransferase n=1 Tax=Posidoniimonas corsicana TaxID=1938618 RepID=A0A5C5VGG4_9BACT|nr:transglutaminase family protein [Posidoniimonas corsicana]TWT37744.1 Protein-glutamine gamma-glutamyltransferase [Posidoniimonas corsicana]
MRYRITHTTKYSYTDPVAVCHNLVHLSPRDLPRQTRSGYRLIILPDPSDVLHQTDAFGNPVEYFSILEAHRGLSLSATSEVEVREAPAPGAGAPWEQVRDALPQAAPDAVIRPYLYAFPSAKAPVAAALAEYARAAFTPARPIVDALREFTTRVNQDFKYDPRATTVSTPVMEAFEQRAGVCQDFAHVAIACLRSIGLAARYVSGYLRTLPPPGKPRLVGADASHAWVSLYCGEDGWVDADPTNAVLPGTDHITIAHGRDYADVCPIQGVYVGGGGHTMDVSVDVAPIKN